MHSIHYDSYLLTRQVLHRKYENEITLAGGVNDSDATAARCLVMMHELGHAMMLDDIYNYNKADIPWEETDSIMALRAEIPLLSDLDHQFVRTLWDLQAPAHTRA